ncbi:MAG: hypothetical protein H6R18_556 [Proteobacteria bacterium]|nr:hypothetical protein [Pseudomonadota bacterium]
MSRAAWLGVLAYRPVWLSRLLTIPYLRPVMRWGWRAAVFCYCLFFLLLLLLRYSIMPGVSGRLPEIEQAASKAIGMPVKIERIKADWQGINPRLTLDGVRLLDNKGQQALAFNRVESVLSWRTVWRFKPILALLAIDGPVLHMRRDTEGKITIAGIAAQGEGDQRAGDWFFEQRRIRIRDATIVWDDAKRQAAPLILDDLQFVIDNDGGRHRFGLSAVPPKHLAARLQVRGDVRGNPMDGLEKLSGQVYAELEYADLAGWRAWVDYPLRLQQGRGALRVWGDWKSGEGHMVGDLALEDVRIQLGRSVPQLDLAVMRGRLQGTYGRDEWQLGGRRIELSTLSGIRVPPTDFDFSWAQPAAEKERGKISGTAKANFVDLAALQALAAYLPLDARSRDLLKAHQPRGRITDLQASWQAADEHLQRYEIRGRFEGLGIKAAGIFPGGSGLSGEVQATEKGGTLQLQAKAASLDLPSVFPEPAIPISEMRARTSWQVSDQVVDIRLEQLDFANPDAAGSAQGSYRYDGKGPGVIDLKAALSRGEGRSVWRYMPHVVHADARDWLKRSITAGTASEVKLVLKGDLRHFPFSDKEKGEFLITAKAKGATLDYAPGWPALTGVEADLRFGVGMQINASAGGVLGTRIGPVSAKIADFSASEELLVVDGQVVGPTTEFLSFIEKSPVMQWLERRTEGMRASGDGKLALRLEVPLRHAEDTRVRGEFNFADNQVTVMPGLPPISQARGKLTFTEKSILAPEITGQALGAPLRVSIQNQGETVSVHMTGGAVMRELRKQIEHPVFDHLSGQTGWKGEVKMQGKTAALVISSNLVGLASSLPEPFNKTSSSAWPISLEKGVRPDGLAGDRLRIVLRDVVDAVVLRRPRDRDMTIEKGAVGIGKLIPPMPARGVMVEARLQRFDADFWRRLLVPANGTENSPTPSTLTRVVLDTSALRLLGRDFGRVELDASRQADGWRVVLDADQASGELVWQTAGNGLIKADFKRLVVPAGNMDKTGDLTESLPGLDVRVGQFSLADKQLGELKLRAHNQAGSWYLDSLSIVNPDGNLKGKGEWVTKGNDLTRLDFELEAVDIGKLLERIKVAVAVRRGKAKLKGNVAWNGPLTTLHYPSLSGDLALSAQKGQFSKLDPGIGKLLGLLSLQSLSRRFTLDFRDITNEGLAFDSIEGKFAIKNGVMRTADELKIDGPAARILIKGEADIKAETQDLTVTVQPEIGGIAAVGVGAAMLNPIVGIGALVANKILQNPLSHIFAYQYRVTGGWSEPRVDKIGQQSLPSLQLMDTGMPARPAVENR